MISKKLQIFLTVWSVPLFFQNFGVAGELRFCHNGPQRIRYQDCPGGFIAKKTLNSTCMYYYKPDGVPNMAAMFSDDICDATKTRELDRDSEEFTQFDFQSIQFTDIDNTVENGTGGDPALDKCNETCLADWMDPQYVGIEPIFIDKEPANDTDQMAKDYVELTKKILIKIINEDDVDGPVDENDEDDKSGSGVVKLDALGEAIRGSPMTGLMKLLAKSMRITYKKCEPFIGGSFYSLVFRTIQELRKMSYDYPNIHSIPLRRILNILDQCEKGTNGKFDINGTECEDKFVVQSITDLGTGKSKIYKPRSNSFRWGRYDPIIEAAWSSVTFVHAFCFDYFTADLLHYSLYVKTMIEIFIQPVIQKHWMYPAPVGKGMTLWEMAYDTADLKNQLRSLDACVDAAYSSTVYEGRLERPFTTEEMMKDPKYEDDTSVPAAGWTKSISEYWKMYEKNGFRHLVNEVGYCLQTPQEFEGKEEFVKKTCPSEDDA